MLDLTSHFAKACNIRTLNDQFLQLAVLKGNTTGNTRQFVPGLAPLSLVKLFSG